MLYLRMMVMTVISLYTSRVVLKVLGVEDFGIYNVVGGIVLMFSFMNSAMALSVNRFFAFELGRRDEAQLQRVFGQSVVLHWLLAGVIVLISATAGWWFLNHYLQIPADRMWAAQRVFGLSIVAFVASIVRVPYHAAIVAYEHMQVFAWLSIAEASLKLLVVFMLFKAKMDVLLLYAALIALVTIGITLWYYIYTRLNYPACRFRWVRDVQLMKELLGYAGLSTFGNMATVVVQQGQNILLNIFFGPVVNAARGVSFQINTAVSGFITNIYTAINPPIVKAYASDRRSDMIQLVYQGTKLSYFLLLLITLPIVLELEMVLNVWLVEVPEYTLVLGRLILINSLIFYLSSPSIIALQATGKVAAVHLITGSINLANLLVSYAYLKAGAPAEVVFYIQIVISGLMTIAVILIQRNQLQITLRDYFREVLWPVIQVTAVSLLVPLSIYYFVEAGYLRFAMTLVLSVVWVSIVAFYLGMKPEMRTYTLALLKGRLRRN